jgi:alpha-tubulin suppressor-like RCC1 family protein
VTVSALTSATSVSAGASHSCAVLADRSVRCWGRNDSGQLGNGIAGGSAVPVFVVGIPPVAWVASGAAHTCAALADEDRIVCWGANGFGQLDIASVNLVIGVGTGPYHSCGVLRDRSVMCSGLHGLAGAGGRPIFVPSINTAVAITAGGPTSQSRPAHTLVVLEDGTVRAWGDNSYGQLGDGTFNPAGSPVVVKGLTTAVAIATGEDHSCALLANSSVSCWGRQVDGTVVNTPRPVGLSGITAIAAGGSHTVARQ